MIEVMQAGRPKLIFINGAVGVGKSTIAQKYIDNHKFALILTADHLVGSMGQWLQNEAEAKKMALQYILIVAEKHLMAGYDVVIPYLLADARDADYIEQMVAKSGADLFEFALITPREEAIENAIARGTWGEPTSPPLIEEDRPILGALFDKFTDALAMRPRTIKIQLERGDPEATYQELMRHISNE